MVSYQSFHEQKQAEDEKEMKSENGSILKKVSKKIGFNEVFPKFYL